MLANEAAVAFVLSDRDHLVHILRYLDLPARYTVSLCSRFLHSKFREWRPKVFPFHYALLLSPPPHISYHQEVEHGERNKDDLICIVRNRLASSPCDPFSPFDMARSDAEREAEASATECLNTLDEGVESQAAWADPFAAYPHHLDFILRMKKVNSSRPRDYIDDELMKCTADSWKYYGELAERSISRADYKRLHLCLRPGDYYAHVRFDTNFELFSRLGYEQNAHKNDEENSDDGTTAPLLSAVAAYWSEFGPVYSQTHVMTIAVPNAMDYDDPNYCLGPEGLVHMASGGVKRVAELEIGDEVATLVEREEGGIGMGEWRSGAFGSTTVVAMTRDTCRARSMMNLNGLFLTPGHPVLMQRGVEGMESGDGLWCRAADVSFASCVTQSCSVYNFVLASSSSLIVNDIAVSTLGQFCRGVDDVNNTVENTCLLDGNSVESSTLPSFFGSERVVDYLRSLPTWPRVTLLQSSNDFA
jgi:hypothetical protein